MAFELAISLKKLKYSKCQQNGFWILEDSRSLTYAVLCCSQDQQIVVFRSGWHDF